MILGISTWSFLKVFGENACLPRIVEQVSGFSTGLELWLDWTAEPWRFAPVEWKNVREMCRGFKKLSAHTGVIHTYNCERVLEEIEFCGFTGVEVLVLHPRSLGIDVGTWDPVWNGNISDSNMDTIDFFLDKAAQAGIYLALENGPLNLLQYLLSCFGKHEHSSRLGICLDTGHANMHRTRYSRPAPFFAEALKEKLIHLHLADNWGSTDDHLVPGDGNVEWNEFLKVIQDFKSMGILEIQASDPLEGFKKTISFFHQFPFFPLQCCNV